MTTLRTVKPGQTVRVTGINGAGATKRRIMDMGITKGADLFIRKVAPLGDPIEVTVRGYELSIRKSDADIVAVAIVGEVTADREGQARPDAGVAGAQAME
jgi:ferrous iron transport protein A